MLIGLGRRGVAPASEGDVIDLLFACHERIRHFTALAERTAHAAGVPDEQIAEAAVSLPQYFQGALRLHIADEDLSLRPRLHEADLPDEVRDAMAQMTSQHEAIDKILARAIPMWLGIARDPKLLPPLSDQLASLSAELRESMDAHLRLEEETIFPAMRRYLSHSSEEAILREMRARRTANSHAAVFLDF